MIKILCPNTTVLSKKTTPDSKNELRTPFLSKYLLTKTIEFSISANL